MFNTLLLKSGCRQYMYFQIMSLSPVLRLVLKIRRGDKDNLWLIFNTFLKKAQIQKPPAKDKLSVRVYKRVGLLSY